MPLKSFKTWVEAKVSVGSGILIVARSTGRFLVGLRSFDVAQPLTWGVWGGKVVGNDYAASAKRELREESGYTGPIEMIQSYVFNNGVYEYHNFVGIVPDEFQPQLNWEHDKAQWVTYKQLKRLPAKHPGLFLLLENASAQIEGILKGIENDITVRKGQETGV